MYIVWIGNADYLSTQYTGTNALKTEYARNGKQTISGNLYDKVNAFKRVVKHQVSAVAHEEEMNIFLGRTVVDGCIKAYSTASRDFKMPAGKAFANDNVFFTKVTRIGHFDAKSLEPVTLRVCRSASLLSVFEPGSYLRSDYPLDEIYDIERSTINYRQLNIYIGSHPFPISLVFPSRKKSLAFYNLLEPILFRTYPLMPGLISKQIPLSFQIFSWDAMGATKDIALATNGISKGKDIYIICANV